MWAEPKTHLGALDPILAFCKRQPDAQVFQASTEQYPTETETGSRSLKARTSAWSCSASPLGHSSLLQKPSFGQREVANSGASKQQQQQVRFPSPSHHLTKVSPKAQPRVKRTYHHRPLLFTARVLEREEKAKTHKVFKPSINATGLIASPACSAEPQERGVEGLEAANDRWVGGEVGWRGGLQSAPLARRAPCAREVAVARQEDVRAQVEVFKGEKGREREKKGRSCRRKKSPWASLAGNPAGC